MNTNLLKTFVDYWKNEYDWRKQEKFLNTFPQFKVVIQGLKIHFLHVKPTNTDGLKVYPLLLVHGWPGSVREFYEIIPLLTSKQSGRNFVFEVIAPSLPGECIFQHIVMISIHNITYILCNNYFYKHFDLKKFHHFFVYVLRRRRISWWPSIWNQANEIGGLEIIIPNRNFTL